MNKAKISLQTLRELYLDKHESASEIARNFGFSVNKVNYWLKKYDISKRTISEAVYVKHNPNGNPFRMISPKTLEEAKLFGLGLGLYWGEGNKANKNTVRLGNSDPALMKIFIEFLIKFFRINKGDLKFHLHLFSDIDIKEAQDYWTKKLKIKKEQFYKPLVSKSGSLGTYRSKSKYGVLTVYYGNTKLKNLLVSLLPM
jgi:hypothetical protein